MHAPYTTPCFTSAEEVLMQKLHTYTSALVTPQDEPIPGRPGQVKNAAGGFAFQLDHWGMLDRFLILGTEGGTYYATEKSLVKENTENVRKCIAEDPTRVVSRVVEISHAGRAPKNDTALFVLALVMACPDKAAKDRVGSVLVSVARTGTHLFNFLTYVQSQRGWGPTLRKAVAGWYLSPEAERLEVQVVKYRQRDGWTHRDVLRKAHPHPSHSTAATAEVLKWVARNPKTAGVFIPSKHTPVINDFELMKHAEKNTGTNTVAINVIQRNPKVTWEMLPSEALKSPDVWQALLPNMPITALIRNLARLTANETLTLFSPEVDLVVKKLTDVDVLQKGRIHPIHILSALNVYQSGKGARGSLTWTPLGKITEALDKAFTLAFKTITPTGKRHLIGLDVSGSMGWTNVNGLVGLTARDAAAAMCMATVRTEPNTHVMAFSGSFQELSLSPHMSITEVITRTSALCFGRTDCALPMLWALERNVVVDVFVIYTDSETWCGKIHPIQALSQYRKQLNPKAKLVVCGMSATDISIADPRDAGMLDVVGFDSVAPKIISDFVGE